MSGLDSAISDGGRLRVLIPLVLDSVCICPPAETAGCREFSCQLRAWAGELVVPGGHDQSRGVDGQKSWPPVGSSLGHWWAILVTPYGHFLPTVDS